MTSSLQVSPWQQSLSSMQCILGAPVSTATAQTQTKHDGGKQIVRFGICQIKANVRADARLHNQKWRATAAAGAEMTLNINKASVDFLALKWSEGSGADVFKEHKAWCGADTDNKCLRVVHLGSLLRFEKNFCFWFFYQLCKLPHCPSTNIYRYKNIHIVNRDRHISQKAFASVDNSKHIKVI